MPGVPREYIGAPCVVQNRRDDEESIHNAGQPGHTDGVVCIPTHHSWDTGIVNTMVMEYNVGMLDSNPKICYDCFRCEWSISLEFY